MSPARARSARVRVLVVDDSQASRSAIEAMLKDRPGLLHAGSAADGEDALRAAIRLKPDVIVLDLNMPRMDGFTFLRLLMAQRPTPVVVLSSHARRSDVFKALDLGALDFVAKPEGTTSLEAVREALVEKCETLGRVETWNLRGAVSATRDRPGARASVEPARVVVVGASTGGPQALQRMLTALPGTVPLAVLVAQHMPEKFTATFAERLARTTAFSVQEAREGDVVAIGRVLVAPGGHHLVLERDGTGVLRVALRDHDPAERTRYCPSVDLLFSSAARTMGRRACAVVLTGMGNDGRLGVRDVKEAGGLTLAEAESSAVVYGMPLAAVETGAVDEELPLDDLVTRIERFARGE